MEKTPEQILASAAAKVLGSIGGKKGGLARAAKLTPEERRASAKYARAQRKSTPARYKPRAPKPAQPAPPSAGHTEAAAA